MNVNFLNPFVDAAYEVLKAETSLEMTRGALKLDNETYVTDDVTVIINLVGGVEGTVLYSMSEQTATALASSILGEKLNEFDSLAQSGVAELGNVITGQASIKLSGKGYTANISTPTLLIGSGATISTLGLPRLMVPLQGPAGIVIIHLALREGTSTGSNPLDIPLPNQQVFNQ